MTLLLGLRERVEQPSLFAESGPGGSRGPGVHLGRAARDGGRENEQIPGHQSDGAWKERQEQNAGAINRLVMLRFQPSVESEFGKPDFHDSFMRDGEVYEVLF